MSQTKICITEKSLLNPAAVLGQIKMEESLGNRVKLYPRNAMKLAAASKCIPDTVFPEAAAVLSKLYSGWTSCSNSDKINFATLLAANIRRIPVELMPMVMVQLHDHSHCTLDMTREQLEFITGLNDSDNYTLSRVNLSIFMRMKELYGYPDLVEKAVLKREWDRYRMMTAIGALRGTDQSDLDLLQSWKVIWEARLKAGPVELDELSEVLSSFGEKMKLTKDVGGFRLDFELAIKVEEPNEIKA